MKFILRQISLPPYAPRQSALDLAEKTVKNCGGTVNSSYICRISVDSRKKNDIRLVYSVIVDCNIKDKGKLIRQGAEPYAEKELQITYGDEPSRGIAVIGFGPCGIFAALTLAENGYDVTVFERGKNTAERCKDVAELKKNGILDPDSNVQFGAGGAGTFSDGKLLTRINDPACALVLKRLVQFGAPEEILLSARPHIGTDLLTGVICGAEKYLLSLGAKIRFGCKVKNVKEGAEGVVLSTDGGDFCFSAAVLATGHSARDTYEMLYKNGVTMVKKPFSVGCRIEHPQHMIDLSMYGKDYEKYSEYLPHAEYNLSYRSGDRGVYSFCMCPGGSVICASTEPDGVVTNGMSCHNRDGKNANSAIAVSVLPQDTDGDVLSGIDFQRRIERAAYAVTGSFLAPSQTVGSFLHEQKNTFTDVLPTYEPGVVLCDLHSVLPGFVTEMLQTGLSAFDRKIRGFSFAGAVLTAPETRTSAPLRIQRDGSFLSIGSKRLYPCGEGAGYAGGITSAAADGINTAVKIINRFKPDKDRIYIR